MCEVRPRCALPALAGLLTLVLPVLAALPAGTAQATTYVATSDADLAAASEVVAVLRVLEAGRPAPLTDLPATRYPMQVERVLQGHLAAGHVEVHVPGGVAASGLGWRVFGAPRFAPGDRALLFLERRADGSYGIVHLVLGAFRETVREGSRLAVRDLRGTHAVPGPDGAPAVPEPATARSFDRFADWLADRARGVRRAADYRTAIPLPEVSRAVGEYAVMSDGGQCGGPSLPIRWFDFDAGGSVTWLANRSGQPGMAGSPPGVDRFRAALDLWSDDAGSAVRVVYGGTTTAVEPGADGTGVIVFDDPADEIAGRFDGSGTLAVGGPFFSCVARSHGGASYRPAVRGLIVTQDGAGSFFAGHGDDDGEEVFAHEIGHTLGLAHSGASGALMRAYAHADGRGAFLAADDRQALADLYGSGDGGGAPPPPELTPPAAPSGLAAVPLSSHRVRLTWHDRSDDESSFRVEVLLEAGFRDLGAVAADSTTAVVSNLAAGTRYTFRVRACNSAGCSPYGGEVSATTPDDGVPASVPAAPTGLTARAVSATEVELAWRDNSGSEDAFHVEGSLAGGSWVDLGTAPADATGLSVTDLEPATAYRFRVRAANASGFSPFSAPAEVTTGEAVPPHCSEPGVLCLQGGRFTVEVEWSDPRRSGDRGIGTPIPGTGRSGFFWFFDRHNVELVVKVLDGRAVNGAFWVFYGALSDIEYEITVTDVETGLARIYRNEPGDLCGRGDTRAFMQASRGAAALRASALHAAVGGAEAPRVGEASCHGDGHSLCLQDGRFEVSVEWRNQRAQGAASSGEGRVSDGGMESDRTGFFWFFDRANVELVVKVLDGRAVNGHHWFFYGALSDVEYEITVRDTLTGEVRRYENRAGNLCGRGDVTAF